MWVAFALLGVLPGVVLAKDCVTNWSLSKEFYDDGLQLFAQRMAAVCGWPFEKRGVQDLGELRDRKILIFSDGLGDNDVAKKCLLEGAMAVVYKLATSTECLRQITLSGVREARTKYSEFVKGSQDTSGSIDDPANETTVIRVVYLANEDGLCQTDEDVGMWKVLKDPSKLNVSSMTVDLYGSVQVVRAVSHTREHSSARRGSSSVSATRASKQADRSAPEQDLYAKSDLSAKQREDARAERSVVVHRAPPKSPNRSAQSPKMANNDSKSNTEISKGNPEDTSKSRMDYYDNFKKYSYQRQSASVRDTGHFLR